ncbi:MAG: Transposase family protein [Mucilaginibacter sp.]|nr:Transposase family protein [Mucilaginibacter sp.]
MLTEQQIKKLKYFVGIDVSKNELDFAVIRDREPIFHREIRNTPEAIDDLFKEMKNRFRFSRSNALFCLEDTGIYGNLLLHALSGKKALVVMENPLRIKKSLGLIREKSDRRDAFSIASFAQKNLYELKLWSPRRPLLESLRHLATLRDRLVRVSKILNMPIRENKAFIKGSLSKLAEQHCKTSNHAVKNDIKKIAKMIRDDERLKRLNEVITSVTGVGRFTALQIIISSNEHKDIVNAKKFARYAGVAPFKFESGLVVTKSRVSHIANKKMKLLPHLCATRAIVFDHELRQYYLRKTVEEKKAKMLVLNAIRNKLILRIFSCLNEDRLYIIKSPKPENMTST